MYTPVSYYTVYTPVSYTSSPSLQDSAVSCDGAEGRRPLLPGDRSTVIASGMGRTRLSALLARRTAARPRGAGDEKLE